MRMAILVVGKVCTEVRNGVGIPVLGKAFIFALFLTLRKPEKLFYNCQRTKQQ